MLAKERQNRIVELVNENGSVLVKELSEQFRLLEKWKYAQEKRI